MPEGCQLPRQAYQNDEPPRHGRKAFVGGSRGICEGKKDKSEVVCLSESSYQSVGDTLMEVPKPLLQSLKSFNSFKNNSWDLLSTRHYYGLWKFDGKIGERSGKCSGNFYSHEPSYLFVLMWLAKLKKKIRAQSSTCNDYIYIHAFMHSKNILSIRFWSVF